MVRFCERPQPDQTAPQPATLIFIDEHLINHNTLGGFQLNDLILWDNGASTIKDFENELNKLAQTLGIFNVPSSDIFMLAGRLLGVG